MTRSKFIRYALWAAMVAAPLVSMLVVGFASGTSVLSIDAWNTDWNDERHYVTTVEQMRLFGEPQGVSGYNEVPAARPSYGPYSVVTYVPYFLGSFLTGFGSHNFMYAINVALGMLAVLAVIVVLRPGVREAAYCAVLALFQFVVARYLCSGMTEASYVLFAALFGSCVLWLAVHAGDGGSGCGGRKLGRGPAAPRGNHAPRSEHGSRAKAVAAYAVAIAACGFWGAMRPFLLAFLLVPVALLVFGKTGLGKAARAALVALAVLAGLAALVSYLYVAKYYATPYFGDSSTLDLLSSLIAGGVGEFVRLHGHFVAATGKSLLTFHWAGIFTFLFAFGWVLLLAFAVRLHRMPGKAGGIGARNAFVLAVALLVSGALIVEANVLLYSVARIHRMLISVDIVYALAIVWLAPLVRRPRFAMACAAYAIAGSLLCTASLALVPGEFAYPQADGRYDAASEQAVQAQLAEALPAADDPWDNTVAHPVETSNLQLYFCLPAYMNVNGCTKGYVEAALADGSFKSKYLSLPAKSDLNAVASASCEVVYEGLGHVVYRLR